MSDPLMWSAFALVSVVGMPINLAIVYYDWYGGDSQKRSLGNRIISVGSMTNIFSTICSILVATFIR